jgi:PKD domain/Secretion system C-terminal sorting domain
MIKKAAAITGFILALAFSTNAATTQLQMQLEVVDAANNQMDLAFIYFAPGTGTTYRYPEDQQKNMDTVMDIPQLYSFSSDSIACYSNGYGDFSSTAVIPLGLNVPSDTTYVLSLAGMNNFDGATLVLLEDRQTGTFTNLRTGSYTLHVYQAGAINNRLYLHVTIPPALVTTASGCANNNGLVSVEQDSSVLWTSCTLFDVNGQPVKSYYSATGNFNFSGLPQGDYNVIFLYNGYQSSKPVQVNGHHIEVNMTASDLSAAVGQAVDFYTNALNVDAYTWQFGDSTVEAGVANPTYTYTHAGNYVVTLTASNAYGCEATATLNMDIGVATGLANINPNPITMINDDKTLKIGIANVIDNNYSYELYNTAGQLLGTGPVSSRNFDINLSGLAAGVYMISVKWNAGTYTKKIVVN